MQWVLLLKSLNFMYFIFRWVSFPSISTATLSSQENQHHNEPTRVYLDTVFSLLCNINTLVTEPAGITLQTNGVNRLQL